MEALEVVVVTAILLAWNLTVIHCISRFFYEFFRRGRSVPAECDRSIDVLPSADLTGVTEGVYFQVPDAVIGGVACTAGIDSADRSAARHSIIHLYPCIFPIYLRPENWFRRGPTGSSGRLIHTEMHGRRVSGAQDRHHFNANRIPQN